MNGQGHCLPRYVGRLAPSPTGWLHIGHARTFWAASTRARAADGLLRLRNDDLDRDRCRAEFVAGFCEDLAWLGIEWNGPMLTQSERLSVYADACADLAARGLAYPCSCSRKEIAAAAAAPHEGEDEPLYPGTCRPAEAEPRTFAADGGTNWRFRVPDGRPVTFVDGRLGPKQAVAGREFGDFLVWRRDGLPSYQLACAVDDAALEVTEVVRGADLVLSTFRQLLILEALSAPAPGYFHCDLVRDAEGNRLAKRHDALSLRQLRAQGLSPSDVIAGLIRP